MSDFTKKIIGVLLIIAGLAALFTPLTPGSWLIVVGFKFLGIGMIFWGNVMLWLKQYWNKIRNGF